MNEKSTHRIGNLHFTRLKVAEQSENLVEENTSAGREYLRAKLDNITYICCWLRSSDTVEKRRMSLAPGEDAE